MTSSAQDKGRGGFVPYLLGAGSLLLAELVFVGALVLPSPTLIAGTAAPAVPGTRTPPPHPASAGPATGEQTEREEQGKRTGRGVGTPPTAPATPDVEEAPSGQPPGTVRLPDGGTASLVRQEVGADSVLPVPDDLNEATWWGAGLDAPSGASVFAGHVDWKGRTGPFAELWNARVGQSVTVTGTGGTKWAYEITRIITLDKNELPARAPELFGQSGPHRLVLVTCGGRWLGGTTGYAENRVVIAEPV